MKMHRNFAVAALLVVTACASQVSLPIVGQLSTGETIQGTNLVDISSGVGLFEVFTLNGLQCSGQYNAMETTSTISIPVACNNGATGSVLATRDATSAAGTATAKLSNGVTGRFLFGNVSANMQAEFLR